MPYRAVLASSDPSPEVGLPMPTFLVLLRAAWPKTRSRWVLAAFLVAIAGVGWVFELPLFPPLFVLVALGASGYAVESTFDQWLSWVPKLSDVYPRSTLVLAFLGGGVLSVALVVALVFGTLVSSAEGPVDVAFYADQIPGNLVVGLVAMGLHAVRTTLRWRYAKRVMRTRVSADYL